MKKLTASAALAFVLIAAPPSSADERSGSKTLTEGTRTTHERSRITVLRDGEPIVEGSGRTSRAVRAAAAFTAIEVEGPTALEVTVGPRESLEIVADDNLLEMITTDVEGGSL